MQFMGWQITVDGQEVGFLPEGNEYELPDTIMEWLNADPKPKIALVPEYIKD